MGGEILGKLFSEAGEAAGEALERRGVGSFADHWLTRGAKAVEERAPALGKMLTTIVSSVPEKYRQYLGDYEVALNPLLKQVEKHPEVRNDFYDYFIGTKTHPDPAVKELSDLYKKTNVGAFVKAGQSGIPLGPPNPDNWSRIWPKGMFEGVNRQKAVQHLVTSGQAKTEAEAEKLLDMIGGKSKGRKSFNLRVGRRVDIPGWRKDVYVQQDAMRGKLWDIAFTEQAGEGGAKINQLLSAIRKRHGNSAYQLADQYVDMMFKKVGKNYRPYSDLERSVNSVMAARYLGLMPLRHLTQPTSTIVTGARFRPMIAALAESVLNYHSAEEWGLRSGAVLSGAFQEMKRVMDEEFSERWIGSKVIKLTQAPRVFRFNRIFASVYGRELAKDLTADYATTKSDYVARRLAELGIDAKRAAESGLTEQDLFRASSRTAEMTQFTMDVNHLPLAWRSHPMARMLTQYKPFIYMQSMMLKDQVIKPAMEFVSTAGRSGDIRPLVYATVLFPSVGEVIGDLYNYATRGDLRSRPPAKYWLDRAVDNVSYVAGFGILNDLVYSLTNWRSGSAVQVPLISEISDLLSIATSKHHAKQAAKQIPVVGRLISSRMRPKASHKAPGFQGWLQKGKLTKGLYSVFGETP